MNNLLFIHEESPFSICEERGWLQKIVLNYRCTQFALIMSSNWLKAMATSSARWGYIFLTKTKEGQMLYFEEWKVLGASQPNVLYKEEIKLF
jgi:hypothetical protein